ncbi:hypothetical protein Dda_6794 [Drechslerella dactyloides]|uniref:Uncharacterized protein n=1 Tax=Drechslerella dactyloides TaxID=74499 RepID=A0AAD6NHV4_DREDA|nr:hypothetical protein Dda_6794 [Drechslerella dactyloides]
MVPPFIHLPPLYNHLNYHQARLPSFKLCDPPDYILYHRSTFKMSNITDALLGSVNPWTTLAASFASEKERPPPSPTKASPTVDTKHHPLPPPLYYFRYGGPGSDNTDSDCTSGVRVFGDGDFADNTVNTGEPRQEVSTPPRAFTEHEGPPLRKASSRGSRFRERLSLESVSLPDDLFTNQRSGDPEKGAAVGAVCAGLTAVERTFYWYAPWILRFLFFFLLASWWSLVPLMRIAARGFQPASLPIIYAAVMLGLVAGSLGLQACYFTCHGCPWMCRSLCGLCGSGGKSGDEMEVESREGASVRSRRRGWVETWGFAVDLVLLVIALAVLGVSLVLQTKQRVPHRAHVNTA